MKTMLNSEGQIDIPKQIREADHLAAGDSFQLERLTPGHYLLAKEAASGVSFIVATGSDGLPVIRAAKGAITSRLVEEIESQTL